MPSLVLYRKYRPRNFSEVVNQNHIIRTLMNALAFEQTAHAYLFSGPRGTGKTTIARILAKSVNCSSPVKKKKNNSTFEFEPCNKCQNCQQINEGRSLDLIEIDAASTRGIDEIRELKEKIGFSPASLPYKVFIIDEVHMLTREAFNALLKTLEEPPEHAIFILVTTEIHKIPATIISRCQRFDFKKISLKEIAERLEKIARAEKIKIEKPALESIALAANGAIRDAESILGQIMVIAGEDGKVTLEETQTILGTTPLKAVVDFVKFLAEEKTSQGIKFINQLSEDGYNLEEFAKSLINYLRKILLVKINKDLVGLVDHELTQEQIKELFSFAEKLSQEKILKSIDLFIGAVNEMKYSPFPQMPLEMALVELDFSEKNDKVNIQEEKSEPVLKEARPAEKKVTNGPKPVQPVGQKAEESKETKSQDLKIEDGEDVLKKIKENWHQIIKEIKTHNHSISAFLKHCRAVGFKDKFVIIATKYKFHKEKLTQTINREIVENVLSEMFGTLPAGRQGKKIFVRYISEEEATKQGYEIKKSLKEKKEDLVASALQIFGGKKVE